MKKFKLFLLGTVLLVSAVAQALEFALPVDEPSVREDQPLTLSNANGNGISLRGSDMNLLVKVTLSVRRGTVALAATRGLTFEAGDGTAATKHIFTATLADANTALDGLKYQPAKDAVEGDSIGLAVVAGADGFDLQSVNLIIEPVNDAPSFQPGADISHSKGTQGTMKQPSWAKELSTGPANESAQNLSVTLTTLSDPAGILTSPLPVLDGKTGDLTYTLSGKAGVAKLQAVAKDDGGTANNGADQSLPYTFTIRVDENLTLVITPAEVSEATSDETVPKPAAQGIITRAGALNEAVEVTVSASDPAQLVPTPERVRLVAGADRAVFDIFTVDDRTPEEPQAIKIFATAPGYAQAEFVVMVRDYDKATVGKLAPEEITRLTQEEVQKFAAQDLQALQDKDLSKILTNVDAQHIKPDQFTSKLPENWQVDATTGKITPPAGAQLTPAMLPTSVPTLAATVELPQDRVNLKAGFSVGGQLSDSVLPEETQLNQALVAEGLAGIQMQQQDNGIVHVLGEEQFAGLQLAVLADANHVFQQSLDSRTGLGIAEGGQFTLTTPEKRMYQFVGAPKDPVQAQSAITVQLAAETSSAPTGVAPAPQPKIKMGKAGDVLIEYPATLARRNRNPGQIHQVVIFDPVITPVAESEPPGLTISSTADQPSRMVYSDHTAQTVYPTVRFPQQFEQAARQMDGVEQVIFKADGAFIIQFLGQRLLLQPTFEIISKPLSGVPITPIVLESGGTVLFSVQDGGYEIGCRLLILPATE